MIDNEDPRHPDYPGDCWRCGESMANEERAELYQPGVASSVIVHAEPCGTEMLRAGWEIA